MEEKNCARGTIDGHGYDSCVDISYRPLRIGWAIQAGDLEAFRSAVRLPYALWGGRFNPILIADNDDETKQLVDLFRVDLIWPIGNGDLVKALPAKFPHLISPFFHDSLFVGGANERKHAQVLDVQNTVSHLIDRPDWQRVKTRGVRLYTWQPDDPLADSFLVQFGAYPTALSLQGHDVTKTRSLKQPLTIRGE